MQTEMRGGAQPIFNLPPSVVVAALVLILVQAVRWLLPDEESLQLLLTLAFIPARYDGAAAMLPGGYVTAVTSFLTYMIVHAGWVHLAVNLLWMAAFGTPVARRLGPARFASFSVLCGIAGAFTHLAFHFGSLAPMVGASAAISGQMAAAIRFIFAARPHAGPPPQDLAQIPLPPLGQALGDRRVVGVVVFWVVLNLMFGLGLVSIAGAEGGIAWEAHIGGFLVGLLCFGLFDQGRREPYPERI